jgi:hypothetical protein
MAFFLCYSCSVTHICSIAYRNHEVLPKPQMSEEFNYNVDALSPLGANTVKGRQGVIYLWAKLPSGAVEVVAKRHGVCLCFWECFRQYYSRCANG